MSQEALLVLIHHFCYFCCCSGKFYHPRCVGETFPAKYSFVSVHIRLLIVLCPCRAERPGAKLKLKTRCPLHTCKVCAGSGCGKALVKCVYCPTAFHYSHKCRPSHVQLMTKKSFLCSDHTVCLATHVNSLRSTGCAGVPKHVHDSGAHNVAGSRNAARKLFI